MKKALIAAAVSVALAGIGHNMPPATPPLTPTADKIREDAGRFTPRRKNKKLWQKRRRPKDRQPSVGLSARAGFLRDIGYDT